MAMRFILLPLTLINVSISVDKLSLTVCLVVSPFSFIFSTILPYLLSISIFHPIKPLSGIEDTPFQRLRWQRLSNTQVILCVLSFSCGHRDETVARVRRRAELPQLNGVVA